MLIARPDTAHVLTRRAVEPKDRSAHSTRGFQQFAERLPVVTPVGFKADAAAQLLRIDLAPLPFVQNVLVTRDDRFHTQHNRAATLGETPNQISRKALRRR